MPLQGPNAGPGKYDDAATVARESTGAQAVVLIVLGGKRGSGMSASHEIQVTSIELARLLPDLLRTIATEIEGAIV